MTRFCPSCNIQATFKPRGNSMRFHTCAVCDARVTRYDICLHHDYRRLQDGEHAWCQSCGTILQKHGRFYFMPEPEL